MTPERKAEARAATKCVGVPEGGLRRLLTEALDALDAAERGRSSAIDDGTMCLRLATEERLRAESKLRVAVEALRFYADGNKHAAPLGGNAIYFDAGDRARAALREMGET